MADRPQGTGDDQAGIINAPARRHIADLSGQALLADAEARASLGSGVAFARGAINAPTGVLDALAVNAFEATSRVTGFWDTELEALTLGAALILVAARVGTGVIDALSLATHLAFFTASDATGRGPTATTLAEEPGRADQPGTLVDTKAGA